MILDCAGTDSSEDDSLELDSAGPGDAASSRGGSLWVTGDLGVGEVMGSDDNRRRLVGSMARVGMETLGRGDGPAPSRRTVVPEGSRLTPGRTLRAEVTGATSCRGNGESRRPLRADALLRCDGTPGSCPGMGDGAAEPLAAAEALRTWARTCDACLSVKYATC